LRSSARNDSSAFFVNFVNVRATPGLSPSIHDAPAPAQRRTAGASRRQGERGTDLGLPFQLCRPTNPSPESEVHHRFRDTSPPIIRNKASTPAPTRSQQSLRQERLGSRFEGNPQSGASWRQRCGAQPHLRIVRPERRTPPPATRPVGVVVIMVMPKPLRSAVRHGLKRGRAPGCLTSRRRR
jgi:hypothetical protein